MEEEMEDLWDRFLGKEEGWLTPLEGFNPRTNVIETENEFEVTVDVPGMKLENFNVELRDGRLLISGEKEEETEEKGKTFHRVERFSGKFSRLLPLPGGVDEEKIQAEYHDGVLKVKLPKTEETKPRHIEIKT
jgi:HSP20 family protein